MLVKFFRSTLFTDFSIELPAQFVLASYTCSQGLLYT